MSSAALRLERFDAGAGERHAPDVREQRARAEGYAEGFAAGQAAAAKSAKNGDALQAALASALAALAEAAPDRLAQEAGDAAGRLLAHVFPALAAEGFAVEAAAAFARLAAAHDGPDIEIAAPAEACDEIKRLLGALAPDAPLRVSPETGLNGPVARAVWREGGLEFDLDRAMKECLEALRAALASLENGASR